MNGGETLPPRAHLLIVDDEANTLASLSRAFRLAGHDAAVCDNATKALELARTQPFDLILSDVFMPGKDGLTLLEELKSQGVTAPVVMMSGQAHIEMAVRATRLGALDFWRSPFPPTSYCSRLRMCLSCSDSRAKIDNCDTGWASMKLSGRARPCAA